jgi:hypothetical protein
LYVVFSQFYPNLKGGVLDQLEQKIRGIAVKQFKTFVGSIAFILFGLFVV